ncbi:acyl carrier protein [Streptomyces sp. WAC 01529]|uniref:acyl carrier protein n=1 Tax=Streptomyces sp. WAC 01529 TaxID=2203205 RepID=UPI000F70B0D0|nr:acyl carrier protein [Streptomyces sp. WAC 01529]AZM55154.1 acyl carrier protein [Streptomyces sp. WAC 01529]
MEAEYEDVWDELRTLCAHIMSVPPEHVVPQARLVADLGADSLDVTELQVASEELFGVSLKGTDPAAVSTVGDVADLIVRQRTESAPGVVAG